MGRTYAHLRRTLAATALLTATVAGSASAQTGGTYASEPPVVSGVTCRLACAGLDDAAPGSTIRLAGEAMTGATRVVFLGGKGPADDRSATATEVTPTSVDAVVPADAPSGRVRVVANGRYSKASTRRLVIGQVAAASDGPVVEARVDSKRVYVDGRRKPSLSYFVGGAAAGVRVDLVRDGDPAPVATWDVGPVEPGTVQSVEWNGTVSRKGAAPPTGRYEFRVTPVGDPGTARAAQAAPVARSGFVLLNHIFPVRGAHDFGQEIAKFGGGRGHEGQDVFAKCGTPLVAAHGGKVKHVATHSRAGNYVVIAAADGTDHAYMHLQQPTPLKKGAKVATGQLVGHVGDTGRASGCHLHFEQWTAPGWYTGGKPVDPLPDLLAWDRVS